MTLSTYLANKFLDHMHGRTSFTMPTTWLALYTSSPGVSGTAITNEASYTGYARIALGTGGSNLFSAAAGGSSSNPAPIVFGVNSSGSSQTVNAIGIVDSASGAGNLLDFTSLTAPYVVATSVAPTFPANSIPDTMA